jgi:ParB family transcriptional regulator, chromosome partitioning protein
MALQVGLNELVRLGTWQPQGLHEMLDQIRQQPLGLDGTGFTADRMTELLQSFQPPSFQPTSQDAQPRLDVRNPIVCPNCGHHFHRA